MSTGQVVSVNVDRVALSPAGEVVDKALAELVDQLLVSHTGISVSAEWGVAKDIAVDVVMGLTDQEVELLGGYDTRFPNPVEVLMHNLRVLHPGLVRSKPADPPNHITSLA